MTTNWTETDDPESIMAMANNESIPLWKGPVNKEKDDNR
jgi:hypothetical protein